MVQRKEGNQHNLHLYGLHLCDLQKFPYITKNDILIKFQLNGLSILQIRRIQVLLIVDPKMIFQNFYLLMQFSLILERFSIVEINV